jgi:Bacterial dnaA protein helix-turn-helix
MSYNMVSNGPVAQAIQREMERRAREREENRDWQKFKSEVFALYKRHDILPVQIPRKSMLFLIKRAAAFLFSISETELESRRRHSSVVEARHIAWWVAREMTQCSLPEIGRAFKRDHTTIMHGIEKVMRLSESGDERTCELIGKLRKAVHIEEMKSANSRQPIFAKPNKNSRNGD